MYKTVATAPYLAALLATNCVGLELVSSAEHEAVATTLEAGEPDQVRSDTQKTSPGTRLSRLRQISDGPTIPCVSKRALRTIETQAAREEKNGVICDSVADTHWQPLFCGTDKKTSIRRLYPSKIPGRAHLAPVSPNCTNAAYGHSRQSSDSSAASVKGTPSPVATMSAFFEDMNFVGESGKFCRDVSSMTPSHSQKHISRTLISNLSEDTTYGTMTQEDRTRLVTAVSSPGALNHKEEAGDASASKRLSGYPFLMNDGSSLAKFPMERQNPSKAPPPPQVSAGFTKGHGRNESIASVWTVDSSSEEDESSPIDKRKPLQLHSRPPLPWFKRDISIPASLLDASEAVKAPSIVPLRSTSDHSERPPIPPRTSSRKSSYQSNRRQSLPADPNSRPAAGTFESWDEEFGEMAIQVPQSIRESQATLRSHLWQLRQFSTLIGELKLLKAQYGQTPISHTTSTRVWQETEAMIIIASYGDENESSEFPSSEYIPGSQDDTIARILGRPKGHHGKVKLNGEILARLIDKAESLLVQIKHNQ